METGMHVQNIRFDEVFDAAESSGFFSYRSDGRTVYGVRLHNRVIPRSGSTFAVAFAEPGNWNTLLGWRELSSADPMRAVASQSSWVLALSDYLFMLFLGGLLLAHVQGGVVIMAALTCVAGYQLRAAWKARRAVIKALGNSARMSARMPT
jgi:hypothetical protein